ncbi:MAG TPA: hypothetical protein VN203_15400, partial [Candidatus Acidoferrum sp.]|nr:hypothetical protein [Candidatus Acidoferrum sp.]
MSTRSKVLMRHVSIAGCLLALAIISFPRTAHATWVNPGATQFTVGGQLGMTTPAAAATCAGATSLGGTSLAVVQSSKLAGVDPTLGVVLVVSCLDSSNATIQAQLNFLNPADGTVVKQISTTTTPSTGWAHLVLRPDKGDLLGCGNDGSIYSIHYSQFDTVTPGTATSVHNPGLGNCAALGWDPDEGMIYQAVSTTVGLVTTWSVHHFKDDGIGADSPVNFPALCGPGGTNGALSGVAVSGGALLVACAGQNTVLRVDKTTTTGVTLSVNGTLGVLGQLAGTSINPLLSQGLSDLACDPVTFQKDPVTRNDTFTDGIWTRNGLNGNGAVALEFPAFTCGMPPTSVVNNLSPLAAGLSALGAGGIGAVPNSACFDANGKVVNAAGDGLPDCWKITGIDFDGDGNTDLQLTVQVNTNGDGVTLTPESASVSQKDLFVEVDWMVNHKPNPQALSQTQAVGTVGVKSVRESFLAAPVPTPVSPQGIHIHLQVMPSPVSLNTLADAPNTQATAKEVTELVMTPCT